MSARRALFNKPKWAAKATDPGKSDGQSIFRQNVYEDILEADRLKEERKAAKERDKELKKQAQQQRRKSTDGSDDDEDVKHPNSAKKRKLSDHHQDEAAISLNSSSNAGTDTEDEIPASTPKRPTTRAIASQNHIDSSPVRHSPRHAKSKPSAVSRDDSVEEVVHIQSIESPLKKSSAPKPVVESSDSEEDETLRELKRRAREESRLKRSATDQQQSPSASTQRDTTPIASTANPPDPELEILIRTIIPGATSLIVRRKASQPFDAVLKFWISRNNINTHIAPKIFLTWERTKLYGSTTGRSILQQIKRKHGTNADGSDKSNGKIEVEAVTDEIWEHRKMQAQRRLDGEYAAEDDATLEGATQTGQSSLQAGGDDPDAARKPSGIILKLSSDSLGTMQLRVRPDTTVVRIARGFAKKMNLDERRSCYLVFDGERLDDEQTVEEVGFEDEDTVDVKVVDL